MNKLDLHISEHAQAYIAEMLGHHQKGALPVLLFGRRKIKDPDGRHVLEEPDRWYLNVYQPSQAQDLDQEYAKSGGGVIFETNNGKLCVPQPQLVAELRGKTLDVHDRNVVIS
jgi:hypothetical protein